MFPYPVLAMRPSAPPPFRRLSRFPLALATLLAGCGGPSDGPPPHRPSDGLLGDAELQAVVERQVARDGAALRALLSAPRAAVRARAALALASVQDTAAVPDLLAALADTSAAVRRDAAFALGQAGSTAAVAPLLQAFDGEGDPEVRRRILEALGKIRDLEGVSGLVALSPNPSEEADRTMAIARLGATRGVATREGQAQLIEKLTSRDAGVRLAAAYYFGRMNSPGAWAEGADGVRAALDGYGKDEAAAMFLTQALGKQGKPEDGGRLRRWARDAADWRTRVNAVRALGALPPNPDNRDALLEALDDPSPHVAVAAAQALGQGSPVPSEFQRMKSWIEANPDRWQAAAPLLVLLAQGDEREFVFGWMDGLAEDDAYRWNVGLQALGFMPGADAVERLQRALASSSPRIRGGAVSALVARWQQDRLFTANHELYFAMFSQVLRGESLQAAFAAAEALSDPTFGGLGNVDTLMAAYRDMSAPDQLEPMMAVLAGLGRAGDPKAIPLLRGALALPYGALRNTAARSLEALGVPVEVEAPEPASSVPAEGGTTAFAPAATPPLDWDFLAGLGTAPVLTLETDRGTVRIRLVTEEAPLTVQTIARLATDGRYDGVPFHRVEPNFVVQGGDFTSGDGFGGPGFTITSEFTQVPFVEGALGMASAGKDTEGSQFFLTHSMQPHLDGGYTAFGWVVEGMDVVNALQMGDRIVRATVEPGA